MKKIRVLVVEDSALMRRIISDIINDDPELELIATARDGVDALEKIKSRRPDVVTMDFEMPRLDGLETLRILMKSDPIPVIMLSSHTVAGSESTLKALDAGAVDFIAKPVPGSREESLDELKIALPQKIHAAASARVGLISGQKATQSKIIDKKTGVPAKRLKARVIVAVGASTGGPKVLEAVFSGLPADLPAVILLSQHMPPGFTYSFAERLNQISQLQVKEAESGDELLAGRALIAPGGFHMIIKKGLVELDSGPKVNFVKPSIDVMLNSLGSCEQKILVVMMTGMGKDGAAGASFLEKVKKDTLFLVQDPNTALIPSMPEAMIKNTSASQKAPIAKMASEIERLTRILS